jgi:hypothetical protein
MKKIVSVWRWAKPSNKFLPVKNTIRGYFGQYEMIVYAGLSPEDWFDTSGRRKGSILHRIDLTYEQAEKCVVAEGIFRPHFHDLLRFAEERGLRMIGLQTHYENEMYQKTITPLLEYTGGLIVPEVLIPFSVRAKKSWLKSLMMKSRRWILTNLGRYPPPKWLNIHKSY